MKSIGAKRVIILFFIVFFAAIVLFMGQTGTGYSWGGGSSDRSSGSSDSSWSSGSSDSSWSGGSSGSDSTSTCIAANESLSLTTADCHKCHTGSDTSLANMHHELINTQGKECQECHALVENPPGVFTPVIVRDCIVCHGPSVHDTVEHCVENTCGRCHPGSIPDIHAGAGSSRYHSGSYGGSSNMSGVSVCYLCHLSTNRTVQQTIAMGLSGQEISCRNCHGGGR